MTADPLALPWDQPQPDWVAEALALWANPAWLDGYRPARPPLHAPVYRGRQVEDIEMGEGRE